MSSELMRLGFVTCVELGLAALEEIFDLGHRVHLAITLHDNLAIAKSGRIFLDDLCAEQQVPLIKCESINDPEVCQAIREARIDWLFIVGWSQIAAEEVLDSASLGCIGMHPTLLPRGRGRASIPWTILKGLTETGVTMFVLDDNLDSGPILGQVKYEVSSLDTATDLYHRSLDAHRTLMRENVDALVHNNIRALPQDHSQATYWSGRVPTDGEITANMTSVEALTLVRATTDPYPGAYWHDNDKLVRVWSATTGQAFDKPSFLCRDGYITATRFQIESLRS